MASLLARRIGAGNVATLINRDAYKAILDDYPFDVVIHPLRSDHRHPCSGTSGTARSK